MALMAVKFSEGKMRLQDKVAIITGAANGIGQATARRFAAEGASVALFDIDEEGLAEMREEIVEDGGRAAAVSGDVTSRTQVQHLIDKTLEEFGTVDVLVNNAGITRDALTSRVKDGERKLMSDEQWDAVLAVNLKGTWLCSQLAAIPMIEQRSGRIINTASVGAFGNVGQANYSASKAGVIGLTRTLALEWARYGIGVNCVAPGGVKTRMTAAIPEKIMERLLQKIPYRRLAEPEEIAAVHLFLASDDAAYITGQVIVVDGGQTTGA